MPKTVMKTLQAWPIVYLWYLSLVLSIPISFEHLDVLKLVYNNQGSHRPPLMIHRMVDQMVLNLTYNSNAVDGNPLTLEETERILKGSPVEGRSDRDHDEVINHYNGILYIMTLINAGGAISEESIKQLHWYLMRNINDRQAGVYRHVPVFDKYAKYNPPRWELVPEQMKQLVTWRETSAQTLHPVERAARLNADLMKIYPFAEDNGRTARLLMNMELLKAGFPPVMVPLRQRNVYFMALDAGHVSGQYDRFISLIVSFMQESFRTYYDVLKICGSDEKIQHGKP